MVPECRRSRGGLYYTSYDEFCEALALLQSRPDLRTALGRNGRRYFEANYSWDVIEGKYLELLRELSKADAASARSGR